MTKSEQFSKRKKRNRFSRFMWHFDRIFGDNKNLVWQFAFIIGLIFCLVMVIGIVGWWLLSNGYSAKENNPVWIQAVGLAFGASNLPPGDGQEFPLWWQTFSFLLGAVFFSGVTITFVGNWLSNRQEAYRNGTVRYCFDDHLLFLGGSRIILPMLKVVASDPELNRLDAVVLTSDDVELVRTDINRTLPQELLKKMRITVLSGDHFDKETLEGVYTGNARRLYIVGEYLSGSEHDSENVSCWEAAKTLCAGRENVSCFLYLCRASSLQLFNRRNDSAGDCLDTTVINFLESVAQRVLVHNGTKVNNYPALDRNGIGPDSERTVHLVVTGTTSMAYAIATTAAHLCHFPNSVDKEKYTIKPAYRTKITYIAPNIKEEMDFITAHLYYLFKLSHYTYIKDKIQVHHEPEVKYGDFLDVEWEFLDGSTSEGWVIDRLKEYYSDCVEKEKTYLTMAFCEMESDRNIAAATYLPSEFHKIVPLDDNVTVDFERTIPLLVFQPNNEKMIQDAHKAAPIYRNMFPFGSKRESYDPSIRQRIKEGKRINYIYNKGLEYQYMTTNQDELDRQWREKNYLEQVSNIYCANHIGVKLRSMGIGKDAVSYVEKIPEKYVNLMAVVEHNRWNIEKLLMGFEPMIQDYRREIKHYEETMDRMALEEVRKKTAKLKKDQYIHSCIASYEELLEEDKTYDRIIFKNIMDVVE